MNRMRGIIMLIAAGIAFYRGWKIHSGPHAMLGYALGALALSMAAWHMTRKDSLLRNHARNGRDENRRKD